MTSSSVGQWGKLTKKSKPVWAPHDYQKRAVKFLLERGAAALFLEPGLGKTSIVLAALKVLKRDKQLNAALIIAPKRVMNLVWPDEVKKWKDFEDLYIGVLHGPKREQVLGEDHDVYVINYESLNWLFGREKVNKTWKKFLTSAGKLLMSKVNILVFDELSKMKHKETQRFKLIEPWLSKFHRRYGLTGSPAPNGLLDLFGQCFALDMGRTLGPYITYYRQEYFTATDDMGYNYVLKHGAEEQIYERLKPLALSMRAEDHLKLPQRRDFTIKVDIPANLRRQYEELEENLLTVLDSKDIVTAKNAAAGNNLCRQFCSGFVYKSQVDFMTGLRKAGAREAISLFDDKLDALEDLIEELAGAQLLVAYEYAEDKARLKKRFPHMVFFGDSDKKDKQIKDNWNAKKLSLVAGHPASIGHGLNLQESHAHNVAWMTVTWDFELFDQFIRRLLRQGNKSEYLNNYMIVARNSVEDSVVAAIRRKEAVERRLKKALKDTDMLELKKEALLNHWVAEEETA